MVKPSRVRKRLTRQIGNLNDVIADLDSLLTEMETDFYRVTIFGSARIKESSPEYQQVHDLAFQLAKNGADIVTGGGPGLMEAANKGAKDGATESRSIGLPIRLPFEADDNSHLDVKRLHQRFSSRLDEFMRLSHSVVVTAGGIGTLLELFYTWQLLQVEHIKPRPFILLGKDMWQGLMEWMEQFPTKLGYMEPKDLRMVSVVDSIDEAMEILKPEIEAFAKRKKAEKLALQGNKS